MWVSFEEADSVIIYLVGVKKEQIVPSHLYAFSDVNTRISSAIIDVRVAHPRRKGEQII